MVQRITAERLADRIDADEAFTLVDTRDAESYEAWHVRDAENVPYDPNEELDEAQLDAVADVADDGSLVTICGKGLSSSSFATELQERGYDVSVVEGGMQAWSEVHETVPVPTADDLVVLQVQRRAKGCLGYVVGSKTAETAAVVDATRETDRFEVAAQEAGLTVDHAFDTHVHADHISGTPRLAEALGVPYHLGEAALDRGVEYEFDPLSDGESVEVGGVEIEALHTPGHTSEATSYLVDGDVLLTGDTLFVDSVGRTELEFGEGEAERGAELLYRSLHETVLELPDDTTVLPGHVTVTSDGHYQNGSPGEPIAARLGDLRDDLDLLRMDEDAFVDRLTDDPPEKPANYETVLEINLGRRTVDDPSEAVELELGPNNCAA